MLTSEAGSARILLAEDDDANAQLFQHILTLHGHNVRVAADGVEALAMIHEWPPDLILLDLDMPRLNGYEVCRRVKQDPATYLIPVIIITAEDAFDTKLQVLDLGADDFLGKPLHTAELVARCRSLLRVKRLIDELETAESVLYALAKAVDAKNSYTYKHSERVQEHALTLAQEWGVTEDQQKILNKGALLHDIGKLKIPDAILDKKGKLDPNEFDIIKQHPLEGVRIVEGMHSMCAVVDLIKWHHERLDGRGYPDGLCGEEIPLLVRILSVADVYDALSSDRPYRTRRLSHGECLEIMYESAREGGLDLELVKCFDQAMPLEDQTVEILSRATSNPISRSAPLAGVSQVASAVF